MKLKIFRENPHLAKLDALEIMTQDVTTLNGITSGVSDYEKGRKTITKYFSDKEQNDILVIKYFEDVLDENNFLIALNMKMEWIDEHENPGLMKEKYIPLLSSEAGEIMIKRRKRQISYLQEQGTRLGVKQYIDMLFGYYSAYLVEGKTLNLLNNYIENGTKEFENAINTEKNEDILRILNAEIPNSGGITVKQSIINQIT